VCALKADTADERTFKHMIHEFPFAGLTMMTPHIDNGRDCEGIIFVCVYSAMVQTCCKNSAKSSGYKVKRSFAYKRGMDTQPRFTT
jgi:hypothetical protein